jgi:hypothetical protein
MNKAFRCSHGRVTLIGSFFIFGPSALLGISVSDSALRLYASGAVSGRLVKGKGPNGREGVGADPSLAHSDRVLKLTLYLFATSRNDSYSFSL